MIVFNRKDGTATVFGLYLGRVVRTELGVEADDITIEPSSMKEAAEFLKEHSSVEFTMLQSCKAARDFLHITIDEV